MYLYMSNSGGTKDITQLAQSVRWSGDKSAITRQLTATIFHDENRDLPVPAVGDGIALGDEEGQLFAGYVVKRSLGSESSTLSITCYDRGLYLKGNDGTYKFRRMTAEQMVASVCAGKGIPVSSLARTGVQLSRKFSAVSLDKIVSTAYSLASEQTGERYAIRMTPEGLLVKVKEQSRGSVNLLPRSNLSSATTAESITSMVNSVAIYSKDGALLRTVEDSGAIALYGTLQKHITQREGEDGDAQARALLEDSGFDRSVTVEVLGDRRLITGETVVVEEDVTGLSGVFWIDADQHTWKRSVYTCKLTLNCRNVMQKTNAGGELT